MFFLVLTYVLFISVRPIKSLLKRTHDFWYISVMFPRSILQFLYWSFLVRESKLEHSYLRGKSADIALHEAVRTIDIAFAQSSANLNFVTVILGKLAIYRLKTNCARTNPLSRLLLSFLSLLISLYNLAVFKQSIPYRPNLFSRLWHRAENRSTNITH